MFALPAVSKNSVCGREAGCCDFSYPQRQGMMPDDVLGFAAPARFPHWVSRSTIVVATISPSS